MICRGAQWRPKDVHLIIQDTIKIQFVGIVIKCEQLCKTSPVDCPVQLFFGAIMEVGSEFFEKVLLGDS